MLQRSILELSSRRSVKRIPRQITPQLQRMPTFLSPRKQFSTASPNAGSSGKPPESKSNLPKVVFGSAVLAGAALLAYQSGYLDQFIGKEQQIPLNSAKVGIDAKGTQHLGGQTISEVSDKLSHYVEQAAQKVESETDVPHIETGQKVESDIDPPHVETEQKVETPIDLPGLETEQGIETQTDLHHHDTLSKTQSENQSQVQHISDVTTKDGTISAQEKHKLEFPQSTNSAVESPDSKTAKELNEGIQVTQVQTQDMAVPKENETEAVPPWHVTTEDISEAALGQGTDVASLLDAYHLKDKAEGRMVTKGPGDKAFGDAVEESNDGYITKDGKLVLNFLEAIHEAEKRQAESDARAFAEEKRALKEKYEKELRDLRARELMRAEEVAILDKEIKRERAKAAAAIRALQERMEEKLRVELQQKENEAEMKLKNVQESAKAELAAAITSEKAAQIEKMAEANLHINALCMAFYARSEEARQINSVHKLALGALALEDALSKGLPIQQELDALNTYLEDIDKDSLLHLVLSTLPEETRYHGTDTLLQLNQKFNVLKGNLRHHILIPAGGGGILTHALAQIASWLRFKEVDPSGDGIESIISRVESFLSEGKLAEAADALQEGVQGSQAEEIAGDWVRRARNRAITEQALMVLQSYATSISLTQ